MQFGEIQLTRKARIDKDIWEKYRDRFCEDVIMTAAWA